MKLVGKGDPLYSRIFSVANDKNSNIISVDKLM